MIGRVYRGSDAGGLVRYLYGPGRHNEHEAPHLVAAWDATSVHDLAQLEPTGTGTHNRGCRSLVAELEAPLAYAERPMKDPIWHCPLRAAEGDRVLTDTEWGEIARDLVHRTGIAPRGDEGACRWIAVRHDAVSIHVMAVLARQDGAHPRLSFDHLRVREACLAAEAKYGLAVTAPADRTAARHTTRAEVERATRSGLGMPARDWLRGQVQVAAAGSRAPGEFLGRLRAAGVVVSERLGEDGQVTGYAVGRAEQGGETVMFGGGKLAADLSLPRLQARWAGAEVGTAAGGPVAGEDLWEKATQAAGRAVELLAAPGTTDAGGDAGGDAAAAAAEVLVAASRLVEGEQEGDLTRAARSYDRAARDVYGRAPAPSEAGRALRDAAYAMARAGHRRPEQAEAARVAVMVSRIAKLSLSVAQLRQAQGRLAQAEAARRAARGLVEGTNAWSAQAEGHLTARRQSQGDGVAAEKPARAAGGTVRSEHRRSR